jgi:hypothetical protein
MAKFMCTFSQVGVKEGWVYNEPNGEVIFSFEVEVAEDAPECDELCSGKECGAYEECNCGPCDWGYSCEGHLCKLDCIQMCSDKECGMHEGCDCGACSKTVVLQAGMSAQVLYWVEVENGVSTSPHDTANFYGSSPIWIGSEYDEDDDGDYVAHKHRAYLWFPLEDELPSDASIVSATLKLDVAQRFGQTGYQVFVKHALEPWEDDVITWDNQPGASNTGLVSVAAPKDTGIYSIPVTDYVQDIVDGVIPYYGEFVRASSEDDAEDGIEANFNFYASGDTGDLPELHIEYQ